MASNETAIVHEIQKVASKAGARLFKNTRGVYYTKPEVNALIAAIKSMSFPRIFEAIKRLRQIKAGLQPDGASDLVGFIPVIITPEMVGMRFARYVCCEVKTATGRPSPEQITYIEFVRDSGGLAGIARSPEDALRILSADH